MADGKLTAENANTAPAIGDLLYMVDDPAGTPATQKITLENLLKVVNGLTEDTAPVISSDYLLSYDTSASAAKKVKPSSFYRTDGWEAVTGTWTYASATTITVASGAASIYDVGDPIRWKQGGGYKYGYIVTVADTLLTIRAGSVYTVANSAITDMYYSKGATPNGFPQYFTLTAPTWTSSGTGFTNQPPTNSYSFMMKGKQAFLTGTSTMHATSGATGYFIATFTTGELPIAGGSAVSMSINASTTTGGWSYIPASTVAVYMAKYDATALATNSQLIICSVAYMVG